MPDTESGRATWALEGVEVSRPSGRGPPCEPPLWSIAMSFCMLWMSASVGLFLCPSEGLASVVSLFDCLNRSAMLIELGGAADADPPSPGLETLGVLLI